MLVSVILKCFLNVYYVFKLKILNMFFYQNQKWYGNLYEIFYIYIYILKLFIINCTLLANYIQL